MSKIKNEINEEIVLNEYLLGKNVLILGNNTVTLMDSIEKQLIENNVKLLTIDMKKEENKANFMLYDQEEDFFFFNRLTKLILTAYKLDVQYYHKCMDFIFTLKDNDDLNITSYVSKLKEVTNIDFEVNQNNMISIEEMMEESHILHMNMKNNTNKFVNLLVLFDKLSNYFREHDSEEWNIKHAVIVKGISNIDDKNGVETLQSFLDIIQRTHSVSLILSDQIVDYYSKETLAHFCTKIIVNYQNDLEVSKMNVLFDKLSLPSGNISFIQTHDKQVSPLVIDYNFKKQFYSFSELFEYQLKQKGIKFIKMHNNYFVNDKYDIKLKNGRICFRYCFFYPLNENDKKTYAQLESILNERYDSGKIDVINNRLVVEYNVTLVDDISITKFICKFNRISTEIEKIEKQL